MNSEAKLTALGGAATGLLGLATLSLVLACADLERGAPAADAGGAGGLDSGTDAGDGVALSFSRGVHKLLVDGCAACHSANGQASGSAFILSGQETTDHAVVLQFVNLEQPAGSRLLSKGAGLGHGGGAIYRPEGMEYQVIFGWITGGAPP